MKRAVLIALMISLTLFCGCSKSTKYEEKFTNWKADYLAAGEHQIEAVVTASDADKVCEYTLLYTQNAEGETVEVLSPELIASIKAQIGEKEVSLSYDGAMLETGSTLSKNFSPLMALPTLVKMIEEGHVENTWSETENKVALTVTELEMPDGSIMTLWQRSSDMTPCHVDIRSGEQVEIKIDIKKFDQIEV